jgi:hypothetical protein
MCRKTEIHVGLHVVITSMSDLNKNWQIQQFLMKFSNIQFSEN